MQLFLKHHLPPQCYTTGCRVSLEGVSSGSLLHASGACIWWGLDRVSVGLARGQPDMVICLIWLVSNFPSCLPESVIDWENKAST